MESMGSKKPQRRRSFTSEFKAEIVDLAHPKGGYQCSATCLSPHC
jgi:transposase-like protein